MSLLRGKVTVSGVVASRSGLGTASLDIGMLELDVPPLGAALFRDTLHRVYIADAHLRLSAVGAATLERRESEPLHIEKLEIERSSITVMATSFLPKVGSAELKVEEAIAVDLDVKDAMSWLYATESLSASVRAPGDLNFGLRYDEEAIAVEGSIFGSDPIRVPFKWPVPDVGAWEIEQIASLVKSMALVLGPELAKRKASDALGEIGDLFD